MILKKSLIEQNIYNMPIDYRKYPDNWLSEIRPQILTRDNNRCKHCNVANYSIIKRIKGSIYRPQNFSEGEIVRQLIRKGYYRSQAIKIAGLTKIVLTIAHLDQDITNNNPDNLAALCQRCHLIYDRDFARKLKQQNNSQLKLSI